MLRRTKRALLGAVVAACAMNALGARTAGAQNSSVTVTYTPLTTTPSAPDFNAGYFVIGFAEVTVNACAKTPCEVQMTNTVTTPSNMRYAVVSSPFATPTSCAGPNVPAMNVLSAPLISTSTTPFTARVYYCLPLTWTGSTPSTFTTPQFTFRLVQRP